MYEQTQAALRAQPKKWLVTGCAGFIGSNLLEALLELGQNVVGLDNFSTGKSENIEEALRLAQENFKSKTSNLKSQAPAPKPEDLKSEISNFKFQSPAPRSANFQSQISNFKSQAPRPDNLQSEISNFKFIEADTRDLAACQRACAGVDYVLHQAALGSVPRSIKDPISSHDSNVTGFLNMLVAARDQKVKRFVYASSSSVYGDSPDLPKVEDKVGRPLSPYAATKAMNEMYAEVFARTYGLETIGLRYFNVFGPRQDPNGAYAAVIPKWIAAMLKGEPVIINGDGETSRDFCYIENVIQANLLAATATPFPACTASPSDRSTISPPLDVQSSRLDVQRSPDRLTATTPFGPQLSTLNSQLPSHSVFNIAVGERTTLNELFALIQNGLRARNPGLPNQKPVYQDFRPGDVRHSLADITKATQLLGLSPKYRIAEGLEAAMEWYVSQERKNALVAR